MGQFSRDQWLSGFFFNTPCLTCQPEVLNYVRCTELCTKLCALYSDCLSVAESFPDAKDPNKARLSLGYREGKAVDYGGLLKKACRLFGSLQF